MTRTKSRWDCGCGVAETDSDGDGTSCNDECLADPDKVEEGECGCGRADGDTDRDGTHDCDDLCPEDADKIVPGECGCGVADVDTDDDRTLDCRDGCVDDANKIDPGQCGCGVPDEDADHNGIIDCEEIYNDFEDNDGDGTRNCDDRCPEDVNKVEVAFVVVGAMRMWTTTAVQIAWKTATTSVTEMAMAPEIVMTDVRMTETRSRVVNAGVVCQTMTRTIMASSIAMRSVWMRAMTMVMALETARTSVHRMKIKFDQVNAVAVSQMQIEMATVFSTVMLPVLMTSPRPSLGCVAVGSPTLTTTRVASSIASRMDVHKSSAIWSVPTVSPRMKPAATDVSVRYPLTLVPTSSVGMVLSVTMVTASSTLLIDATHPVMTEKNVSKGNASPSPDSVQS